MPVLAAFLDTQNVTALLYKSLTEYYLYTFPYVYSKDLFSASFSETDFYRAVFDYFCKQQNLKLADCDLVVTGFLEPPKLNMNLKMYVSLFEVLQKVTGFFPIVVNNYSLFTPTGIYSSLRNSQSFDNGELMDIEEVNYYANMSIYPQIVASDLATQTDIDKNIRKILANTQMQIPTDKPITFCGSRFAQPSMLPELDYILILNLIQKEGIYDLRIDRRNTIILFTLLNMFDQSIKLDPIPDKEGTLISTHYSLECMVKSEFGTSQIVQLEKNRIFVLPVGADENPKIVLKSHNIDSVESQVSGGKIGLIFDTRENRNDQIEDFKIFNSGVKTFSSVLGI